MLFFEITWKIMGTRLDLSVTLYTYWPYSSPLWPTLVEFYDGIIIFLIISLIKLYSWIKGDQLDVTCFIISLFNAQHVSDVNTSILRSLRLICWVISWVVLLWFDVRWCYVVVVWYPYAALLQPAYGYHATPAKPQRKTNTHGTRAIQPMK